MRCLCIRGKHHVDSRSPQRYRTKGSRRSATKVCSPLSPHGRHNRMVGARRPRWKFRPCSRSEGSFRPYMRHGTTADLWADKAFYQIQQPLISHKMKSPFASDMPHIQNMYPIQNRLPRLRRISERDAVSNGSSAYSWLIRPISVQILGIRSSITPS